MISPAYLHPGDTVALVATARKVSPGEVAPTIQLLQSWGLNVHIPAMLYAAHHQFAGTDQERSQCLQQLLDSPDIQAILCVRGGYGTVRMLDALDFTRFLQHPKWLIGYSDVTALHSHIHSQIHVETLHATMSINITPKAISGASPAVDTLRQALFGQLTGYHVPGHPLNRVGEATGQLVGGNLSILYSLCGSPSALDTHGKILFIEDLDEYLYHLDRMMQNLKRNGMLSHLAGLVVGQFSDMHDNTIPFGSTAQEIILDAVREYSYPVCFNFPSGHNGLSNHALLLGRTATLQVSDTVSLTFAR